MPIWDYSPLPWRSGIRLGMHPGSAMTDDAEDSRMRRSDENGKSYKFGTQIARTRGSGQSNDVEKKAGMLRKGKDYAQEQEAGLYVHGKELDFLIRKQQVSPDHSDHSDHSDQS